MTRDRDPKLHAGFRFTSELLRALDGAADSRGITRTALVEHWLEQRAIAEGWMEPNDAMGDSIPAS